MKLINFGVGLFFTIVIGLIGFIGFKAIEESATAKADTQRWERVDSYTERLRIRGGWLVWRDGHKEAGLTFVPDEKHEWRLDN